ncbi:hypothetical protein DH2020_021822 [Rehmannia glutinosa]|uniref:F-box protein n=1 Tax=Rehmannia glutinosa TaxID=99300 RepID=A0ABR0WFD2_REHGL
MEKTKQYCRKESIDRLSALPDAILCHILSFLPTKLSMATSILSRRWRFLWAHVPNLDFESENHGSIYRVMSLYKVENMDTFSLCFIRMSQSQLETCIDASVIRNVKNISLIAPNNFPSVSLPCCILTCKTLVDLTLYNIWDMPMTGDISLPALKRLCLDSVFYDTAGSLPHLLSGCPVLDELIVERTDADTGCFYISSPTLKRLMFSSYFDNTDEFESEAYTVEIDTPALSYLHVYSRTRYEYVSVGSLTSLIEADIDLEYVSPMETDDLLFRSTLEFVGRLCNVKCLKLSIGWMEVPDSEFSALNVKFHNLTKLEIAPDWRFISNFLENADKLEVLMIRTADEYLKYWMEPKQVPTCLLLHLGTVRIDQFVCTEPEFNMVRYILRNAKVLKRMEIYTESHGIDLKEKFVALKIISLFQRGSEACELVFH